MKKNLLSWEALDYTPKKKGNTFNQKEYVKRRREILIHALGGKCVECAFDDIRALQVDHINGGGSRERKKGEVSDTKILESFLKKENKYQLLCANCNWIKRFKNGEHKKVKNML